ncbi:MAG: HAMP domain-containing protein, partial [Candidatus Omnitrophica bacterium]|nr:HAMP domain-containing protein [Candidatus Omnitrophota bacterium]
SFGVFLLFIVLLGGYAFFSSEQVGRQARHAELTEFTQLLVSIEINGLLFDSSELLNDFIVSGRQGESKSYILAKANRLKMLISEFKDSLREEGKDDLSLVSATEERLMVLEHKILEYEKAFEGLLEIDKEDGQLQKEEKARNFKNLDKSIKGIAGSFLNEEIAHLSSSFARIDLLRSKIEAVSLFLTFLLLLLGVAMVSKLTRKIVRSLDKILEGTKQVALGDFKYRIPPLSKDEFGQLAVGFNRMTGELNRITVMRDFLEAVINSLKYSFYIIDTDYVIQMANAAAKENGIKPGIRCYECTHHRNIPCSEANEICPLEDVIREKKSVQLEHIHYDQQNRKRIFEIFGDPIFDKDGNVVRMIEYTIDITERKEAENRLKQLMKELETKNKELDDFNHIISHDLKEPLRAIHAFSRFIEVDFKEHLSEKSRYYLEKIQGNALKMQELIEGLREISSLGHSTAVFRIADSRKIVRDVVDRFEYQIKDKNARVIIAENMPEIFCDPVRIAEVFANLISNALKFSDKNLTVVEIGGIDKNKHCEFYVKDNGQGIEPEYFEKIFEIFQRLGRKEDYAEGTGIGLSIAKKIIEMHCGRIWVNSELGKGTVFYFTLPKNQKDDTEMEKTD